ncbi:MAG: undecaprenyl-diphosphate phosphatase [Clostridia bacterium]|nr:undecaprenyl-diphosphate phosphatase [Clostridia bacterium]
MPVWIALVLGIVQGLTEFLPVSSSGHLALMQNILDVHKYLDDMLAFDVVLHLGTLTAVAVAFWSDIRELFVEFFGFARDGFKVKDRPYRRMIVLLLISTALMVPAALLDGVVSAIMGSSLFIGCALCVTAVMLTFADKTGGGDKTAKDAPYRSALVVGIMQLFAVIPGISRSGSTLCGGLFCGYDRSYAVKFAFILSIPAVLGAAVLQLPDMFAGGFDKALLLPCVIGFVTSAVFGYLAIKTVQWLTQKRSLRFFGIYCAAVGIISILLSIV